MLQEAKNEGFADSIDEASAVEMKAGPRMAAKAKKRMKHIPEAVLSAVSPKPDPTPEPTTSSTPEVKVSKTKDDKGKEPEAPKQPETVSMTVAEYEALKSNQKPQKTEMQMAAEAERHRVTEIHSVCQMAGIDAAQIKKYVDEGTSLDIVQKAAITTMSANNPPASDGGGDKGTDENAAYRKEYRDVVNDGVSMSCTEDEYVNVRREEEGKKPVDFSKKGGGN